ncbi:hypothetical protein MUK42_04932 [Musa troglodytarum]|uniref:Clp R domain-containing protein n=1 Tax=Musa troglodytarum TaxID=320322 RepID=A0A9E7LD95_9LILI|nr:hypothetical protein MUK42_04932 [Musa troglodytarum]
MPTPVGNARACLAAEAAAALDGAVSVALRRAHAQTTSLHVVYALLLTSSSSCPSLAAGRGAGGGSHAPCSILGDALSRARSSVYSPGLQFKALELCFGVALDRQPSSSSNRQAVEEGGGGDEPPVSNSLMAAIKRSQASQRRNPETLYVYQQQQSPGAGGASSFSGAKVELQQLLLAILDDPVVSRVFGDAGFRSTDIKLAILRPPPPMLRFPRAAPCSPLFLCNFSARDGFETALTSRELVFPFPTAAAQLCSDGGGENCRRIGEILARKSSGRNPMLVGVGAGEAARDFAQVVERQNWAVLPPELHGIKLVSIEKEVAELSTGGCDQLAVGIRLEEMGKKAESPGAILNIGDLKRTVEGCAECNDKESCLVSEVTRLLEVHHGRLWVMGWSATYETYMKFLCKHPMLDKDWDLQLLPITSVRTGMGRSPTRPSSLMESFVPLGGFFPTAHESKGIFSSVCPSVFRYDNCEQEVSLALSVDGQQNANLPFWLHKANMVSLNDGSYAAKAKDDQIVLNAKIMDLEKKWNDNSQCLHHGCQTTNTDDCAAVDRATNPSCISNMERACSGNGENPDDDQNQRGHGIPYPISVGTQKIIMAGKRISLPSVLEPENEDLLLKLQVRPSKGEQLQREFFQSHQGDEHASPSSVTSVVTDLVLGTLREPLCNEENFVWQEQKDHSEDLSGCLPSMSADMVRKYGPDAAVESSSDEKSTHPLVLTHSFSQVSYGCASANNKTSLISSKARQKFDLGNYKSLCSSLINKVCQQEEAAIAAAQAIVHCKTGERRRGASLRGDVWLGFRGPDKIGKKRVAMALAETIYGIKENFVCIDLSYQDCVGHPSSICNQQDAIGNGLQCRGKMNVDHIATELSEKLRSVVFLENVDKADLLVQNSLSQAIRTGKFPDSHGREMGLNDAIFILTSAGTQGQNFSRRKDHSSFSEENILAASCWQMKIFLEPSPETAKLSFASTQKPRNDQVYEHSVFVSKRKLDISDDSMSAKRARTTSNVFLDLNLPVEDVEGHKDCSKSENSAAWMEDFLDLVDATVDFKPIDFDAFADSILKDINKIFLSNVGSDCVLEIDQKAMEEILAAAWSSEDRGALNNWFEQVLVRSSTELRCRHNPSSTHNILRLVACMDTFAQEHAPGVLLPSTIIID